MKSKTQEIEEELKELQNSFIIAIIWIGVLSIIFVVAYFNFNNQISQLPHKVCKNETIKLLSTDDSDIKVMTSMWKDYSNNPRFIVGDITTTKKCYEWYCEEILTRSVCELK